MYDIIAGVIDHSYTQGDSMQSYILYICASLIILLTCVFIDLIYRVIFNFFRS